MKLAIFGALAFVLGLAGSTGAFVLTTPVKVSHADSVAVAKAVAARGAAHAEGEVAEAGEAPAHASAPAAHAAAAAAPAPAEHESVATVPAPAPPIPGLPANVLAAAGGHAPEVQNVPEGGVHEGRSATAPDAESFKQVGSILLNMKPVEAAKIVGYLNDDQVEGLLRSMSPRQAAGVLGQLPAERAAALSRRLLTPKAKP